MKRSVAGLMIMAMMVLTGCVVSQSTHEQTLQDLQATKSDLDRMRVQNEALNKQLKVLQEAKIKLREDLDKANGDVSALTASVGKERQAQDNRLRELERQVKELTAARRTLAQELEVQKQKYEIAQRTIKRQQKELKEREQSEMLPAPAPPRPSAGAPEPPATSSPSATMPAPPPVKPASPEPPKLPVGAPPATMVDINKSSEADLVLTLGLGKEDSQKLIRNRPYRTKDELVTKAGISKATVDRLRDKILVTP